MQTKSSWYQWTDYNAKITGKAGKTLSITGLATTAALAGVS